MIHVSFSGMVISDVFYDRCFTFSIFIGVLNEQSWHGWKERAGRRSSSRVRMWLGGDGERTGKTLWYRLVPQPNVLHIVPYRHQGRSRCRSFKGPPDSIWHEVTRKPFSEPARPPLDELFHIKFGLHFKEL